MKRFLTTTATALVFATGAYAETTGSAVLDYDFDASAEVMASNFIGMRVYATEAEFDASVPVADGGETEWDDIGEINDVVLTRDGSVGAIIVGVGGFLGLGEKDVAVDMSQIAFVQDDNDTGDYFLVIKASQAALEGATDFDWIDAEAETQAMMKDAETMGEKTEAMAEDVAMDEKVEKMGDEVAVAANETDAALTEDMRATMTRPEIVREGYVQPELVELTSENLTGARVYGINDEDVGEVSELILNDDGMVEKAVIDVGGFLGLGEKPVAVSFEELNIQRSEDGGEFRVYIDATEDSLEAQPEFTG